MITGRNHRLALRPDTLAEASGWIEGQCGRWRPSSTPLASTWRSERTKRDRPQVMGAYRTDLRRPGGGGVRRWTSRGDAPLVAAGPDWETAEAEVDLRVGGKVRVLMRKSDGSEVEAGGEYTLIERPHRRDDVDLQRRSRARSS